MEDDVIATDPLEQLLYGAVVKRAVDADHVTRLVRDDGRRADAVHAQQRHLSKRRART